MAEEFSKLVPGWFSAMFLARPRLMSLEFHPNLDQIERRRGRILAPLALLEDAQTPPLPPSLRAPVDAALPEAFFLKRRIAVPQAASRSLQQVAALDLARRTPFRADEVHWALSAPQAVASEVVATQWVAMREDIEALRGRLARIGLVLMRAHVATDPGAGAIADLPGPVATRARTWRRLNALLGVSAAILAAALWLLPGWVAARALVPVSEDLAARRAEALTLRREVEGLRALEAERAAFVDTVIHPPRLAEVLRDLSVAIPDEVWISEMGYRPSGVTVSGETSASAADLVLALSTRRGFANPRLNGPVARTATGGERFGIALDMEQGR